ncbi:MAG TPA: cation:proton antiporter [Nocardioidaceae bacterium]|nr:cation:proton antiporter [Nocardioidaceae bacterium]
MTLLAIAVIVAFARLLGALALRVHQPAVVGEIVAGIVLGPSLLGALSWGGLSLDERLFPEDVQAQLLALANLGLVIFMFVVGLELDLSRIRSQRRQAVTVSVSSVVTPMVGAAFLSLLLWSEHGGGGGTSERVAFALFIGVAMAVTAFPVLARILAERNMHRTALGSLALAAAAVDDVLAWSLLAVATTIAGAEGQPPWVTILLIAGFVVVMMVPVRRIAAGIVRRYERAGRITPDIFGVVIMGILLSAWVTDWIGIHFIFGAFLFGTVFPRDPSSGFVRALLERLEDISVLLLLPVFFVVTGLRVDVSGLQGNALLVLLAVVVLACATKFLGSYSAARLTGVRNRPAMALGVLMNTRGLTELVVVNVGYMAGILDGELLTIFIVMAVVTTVMTEPLLRLVYPDDLVRRDVSAAEQAALGVPGAHRVLAILRGQPADRSVVRVAEMLLSVEPPGRVVLSQIVPPQEPSGELGSGLADALGAVADAVEGTAELVSASTYPGLDTVQLTRIGADPVVEWCSQAEALDVDGVVVGVEDLDDQVMHRLLAECSRRVVVVPSALGEAGASVVQVVRLSGEDSAATFDVGLRLAAAEERTLVVGAPDERLSRRAAGWLRRGRLAGLDVLRPSDVDGLSMSGPLVVAPVDAAAASYSDTSSWVFVRAGASEPVDLIDNTFDLLTQPTRQQPGVPLGASHPQ